MQFYRSSIFIVFRSHGAISLFTLVYEDVCPQMWKREWQKRLRTWETERHRERDLGRRKVGFYRGQNHTQKYNNVCAYKAEIWLKEIPWPLKRN